MQLKDLKDDKDETGTENENYIETLEKDMAEMKETHQATIVKLRQEHQKEVWWLSVTCPCKWSQGFYFNQGINFHSPWISC